MDTKNIHPEGEGVGTPSQGSGGASRLECPPNHTGEGPRRDFASEALWKEQAKREFFADLDSLLARFGGELRVEIDGNASAYIEATISEYATCNGENRYFYAVLDLGGYYVPKKAVSA